MTPVKSPRNINFRTPFVRVHVYQHMWDWIGCFRSSRSIISPCLRAGQDQRNLKIDTSIYLKAWNLRVDRPQLSLGLTLSAAFIVLPASLGSLRGFRLGLQVRHHHQVKARRGRGSAAVCDPAEERRCFQVLFCYPWEPNLITHERIKNYPY